MYDKIHEFHGSDQRIEMNLNVPRIFFFSAALAVARKQA